MADPAKMKPRASALTVFGLVVVCSGALATLALFGLAPLTAAAELWRTLFGWLSLPIAVAVLVAGVGALTRRAHDPWTLPWGRTLGLEVTIAAALALLASAFGAPTTNASAVPSAPGPGGLVGWSLAAVTTAAVGPVLSTLVWFGAGMVGLLALFRIGASHIAAQLESVADALADGDASTNRVAAAGEGSAETEGQQSIASAGTGAVGSAVAAGESRAAAPDISTTGGTSRSGQKSSDTAKKTTRPEKGSDSDVSETRSRPVVLRVDGDAAKKRAGKKKRSGRQRSGGHLPDLALFDDDTSLEVDEEALHAMSSAIEQALAGFGVPAQVVEIEQGPTVTRFGVKPGLIESGQHRRRVRVARIATLKHDLALALSASTVRIEAPIPGRPLVGIEVPNPQMNTVGIKGLVGSKAFRFVSAPHGMAVALGRDVAGSPLVADLATLPHLLVAGATGSGKSVCLDAILASLLCQCTPDTLRLVLIDPKRVELARFDGLPHLVARVVTDMEEIVGALRWVVAEMEARYKRFEETGARDRDGYNDRSPAGEPPMPALVIVIDELADMMMVAPEATEPLLVRVAQLGRATGIHLVVATQRPSVDVVTGLIKANFPARISFAVASGTDSRVILDQPGAELLLGRGDMLYQAPDAAAPQRAQGAYVSDKEIVRLVKFWSSSHWGAPTRVAPWNDLVGPIDPTEALYQRASELAAERTDVTASLLQRRLHVGYPTARDLYDRLADDGLVDVRGAKAGDDEDLTWVDDEYESP